MQRPAPAGTGRPAANPGAMTIRRPHPDQPGPAGWRLRAPGPRPARFADLDDEQLALLRALAAFHVDHVVVGSLADAVHGRPASGPLAVVPAPYARNFDKLADALRALAATPTDASHPPRARALRGRRLSLTCEDGTLDIRGDLDFGSLHEQARREELEPGLGVQIVPPHESVAA